MIEPEILQEAIDEIVDRNSEISPQPLRFAVEAIIDMAEQASLPVHGGLESLILSEYGQGFVDGYCAYRNGDFSVDAIETDPDLDLSSCEFFKVEEFTDLCPSYIIARATYYVSLLKVIQPADIEFALGPIIPETAGTGFLHGFLKAQCDKNTYKRFTQINAETTANAIASLDLDLCCDDETFYEYASQVVTREVFPPCGNPEIDGSLEDLLMLYSLFFANAREWAMKPFDQIPQVELDMLIEEAKVRYWCRINGYGSEIEEAAIAIARYNESESNEPGACEAAFVLSGIAIADGIVSVNGPAKSSQQEELEEALSQLPGFENPGL